MEVSTEKEVSTIKAYLDLLRKRIQAIDVREMDVNKKEFVKQKLKEYERFVANLARNVKHI